MEKITIIIPAYNEEKRIAETLEEYGKFFTNLKKNKMFDSEILIVINNTNDRTEEIVRKYQKKYHIIKYLNFKKGGKGFAITEGFKQALKDKKNSLIGFVDADMATKPNAFYDLIINIANYDGIIASRYIPDSKVYPKQNFNRILVSRVFNFLIRCLFLMNYVDTQCGAKIFRREALEKVISSLGITRWAYDVDLLYQMKRNNFQIKEFPTVWSDKAYSKINLKKSGTGMVLGVIRLKLLYSHANDFIRLYDKIMRIILK